MTVHSLDTAGRKRRPKGTLEVLCWCQEQIVVVPQRWVMQGRTASCGGPECNAGAA